MRGRFWFQKYSQKHTWEFPPGETSVLQLQNKNNNHPVVRELKFCEKTNWKHGVGCQIEMPKISSERSNRGYWKFRYWYSVKQSITCQRLCGAVRIVPYKCIFSIFSITCVNILYFPFVSIRYRIYSRAIHGVKYSTMPKPLHRNENGQESYGGYRAVVL